MNTEQPVCFLKEWVDSGYRKRLDFHAEHEAWLTELTDVTVTPLYKRTALEAAAPELLDELKKAHEIIIAMLNALHLSAKFDLGKVLSKRGLVDDGITRHNERDAVIRKAEGRS